MVWEALQAALDQSSSRIVDVGGGTGGFAVRLAQLGHRVTVVDPSPDALAALDRRAREVGVEVTGLTRMAQFIDRIIRWAAMELQIVIPEAA